MTTAHSLTCFEDGSERLGELAPAWAALVDRAPGGHTTPFAHPAWYSTWLKHFPQKAAFFLSFREGGGRLVGIVPLVIDGATAIGLGNPKIQDYTGAVVEPGQERAVAGALLAWAAEKGIDHLRLWGLVTTWPLLDALEEAAPEAAWRLAREPEAVAPVAAVGGDWDRFVASLSKKDRHELRRKLRNLEAAADVAFETLLDPGQVGSAVGSLLRMMRESHEGKTRFLTPEMASFFQDLAPTMAAAGSGRVWRLVLDDEEAALLLGFDLGETRFLYNSGYDTRFRRLAVGLLSKALAMKAGAAEGRRRFDFMRGDEEYKRRLGGKEQQIVTVDLKR